MEHYGPYTTAAGSAFRAWTLSNLYICCLGIQAIGPLTSNTPKFNRFSIVRRMMTYATSSKNDFCCVPGLSLFCTLERFTWKRLRIYPDNLHAGIHSSDSSAATQTHGAGVRPKTLG